MQKECNEYNFSGDESQKVCAARAFYKNTGEVYIFNEPTATLDPLSEQDFFNNLLNFSKEKFVVFISHRMSCCTKCDNIIVMQEGKTKEQGNHSDLMSLKGIYYNLFNTQKSSYSLIQ